MDLDTNRSLSQLLGAFTNDTTDSSALATTCLILYEKPLKDFTVENFRVMIGQGIGLELLIPLAVELLQENPFVEGDYYPGDLLSVVMQVEPGFWQTHQDVYWSISEIVAGLPSLMSDLTEAIRRFDALASFEDLKPQ
ncbi:MAG TPA: contact-dependent growth inhibition system immunity protein [Pyrinomonadaceae bacterium]|nr:contact-dependent growth inhibition system immunity protein [Pyrinomonadaceae bacterium]